MSSPDGASGLQGTGLPNQSRFIPGSPALPNMGGSGSMPGALNSLQGTSLLGRDVSPAPSSPVTQPLHPVGLPPLNLGVPPGNDASSAAHVAAVPPGRSISSLRAPRGTNFIRLAFAAIFLLGFLGLVGFLLKDYLPDLIPGLISHDAAEEASKDDSGISDRPFISPNPSSPAKLAGGNAAPEKPSAPSPAAPEARDKTAPITVGFDPQEPAPSKVESATPAQQVAVPQPATPPTATSTAPLPPTAPAAGPLLEVPAKPVMNGGTPGTPAASPSSLSQSHTIEEEGITAESRPAAEALKKFLLSKSLEERLKHTLGADLMKPHMERYYAHAPDGPILVDRIQFVRMDPNPELGSGKHCIFSLENKTWEFSVPVMLEEKEDGFKVDWVAFVEFKDRMLEKFFQAYMPGKACFHVGIIRRHFFEDGVPNLDRKDAFRVMPAPPNSFEASVFIDKDSALAEELRTRLPWETHVWAVVELEWKKLGSQQWVELSAVPQMHWYSLPMAPKASAPAPKTAQADEFPPGISKNGSRGRSGAPSSNNNMPPPGIRKSSPDLPDTIKRPVIPGGR